MFYGMILWCNTTGIVFITKMYAIMIMCQINSRTSCTEIFKKIDILTLSDQVIFLLIVFAINNYDKFSTYSDIFSFNTINKNKWHKIYKALSVEQKFWNINF